MDCRRTFDHPKVKMACELLQQTDMKVNQICHKIGIADSYYFSRLFSKTMGVSPRAYRKMNNSDVRQDEE